MGVKQEPLVSVIIPSFNNARFLPEAIESILNQSYTDVEIIVVDDGSTDDTQSVLARYGDRLVTHTQTNQGVCVARNQGLEMASGEYVVFLDADDYFLPDKIRDQVDAFLAAPYVQMVHSGWDVVNEDGSLIHHRMPWTRVPRLDLESFLLWKPVHPAALMFRKDLLVEVGGFDSSLSQAEDVDLMLRLLVRGARVIWLRQATACYRQHGNGAMRRGIQQALGLEKVLDKFFSNTDLPQRMRRIEARVWFSTYVWLVWHLYQTGHREAMAEYIDKAQRVSRFRPVTMLTMLHWQQKLSEVGFQSRASEADIEAIWPFLRGLAYFSDQEWAKVEATLGFWLRVWRHYLNYDELGAIRGLRRYLGESPESIMALAVPGAFVSPNGDLLSVSMFRSHLRYLGLESGTGGGLVAAVYLSLGSHLLSRAVFRQGLKALGAAAGAGLTLGSLGLWLRSVVRPGLRHLAAQFRPVKEVDSNS